METTPAPKAPIETSTLDIPVMTDVAPIVEPAKAVELAKPVEQPEVAPLVTTIPLVYGEGAVTTVKAVLPDRAEPVTIGEIRRPFTHVGPATVVPRAEVSDTPCPVCNYTYGSTFAVTRQAKYFECHHCNSVWTSDIPGADIEYVKANYTHTAEKQLATAGDLVMSLATLARSLAQGDQVDFIKDYFRSGQTVAQLNWQHAFDNNPRVIPTRTGVAIAARHVGLELITQAPTVVLRKPVDGSH